MTQEQELICLQRLQNSRIVTQSVLEAGVPLECTTMENQMSYSQHSLNGLFRGLCRGLL